MATQPRSASTEASRPVREARGAGASRPRGAAASVRERPVEQREEAIAIVIADDHALVRSALRILLDAEPGFEVVAEAGNFVDAVRAVDGHRPKVVVLDLNMPGGAGLTAIPELRARVPETQIVVLTMQNDPAFAREALRAGAMAYVLKEAADTELVEAIRRAAAGRSYLAPELGARVASEADRLPGTPAELSERERQVLRLIALGHTNAEIAGQLGLSVRTIESHRAHIQRKLHRSSRAELVGYAIEHGMLERASGA